MKGFLNALNAFSNRLTGHNPKTHNDYLEVNGRAIRYNNLCSWYFYQVLFIFL